MKHHLVHGKRMGRDGKPGGARVYIRGARALENPRPVPPGEQLASPAPAARRPRVKLDFLLFMMHQILEIKFIIESSSALRRHTVQRMREVAGT